MTQMLTRDLFAVANRCGINAIVRILLLSTNSCEIFSSGWMPHEQKKQPRFVFRIPDANIPDAKIPEF